MIMSQKIDAIINSQGDTLLPLEKSESACLFIVNGSNDTFFVTGLELGDDNYDLQSKRYLTKTPYLKGGEQWEKHGRYVRTKEAAMKAYQEINDPVTSARKAKDAFYKDFKNQ
jgi:hypothetical protein